MELHLTLSYLSSPHHITHYLVALVPSLAVLPLSHLIPSCHQSPCNTRFSPRVNMSSPLTTVRGLSVELEKAALSDEEGEEDDACVVNTEPVLEPSTPVSSQPVAARVGCCVSP